MWLGYNELEYYTNRLTNAYQMNGSLIVQALKEEYAGSGYTSARLTTQNLVTFIYGYIAARIKLSLSDGGGDGLWPAFWMMGASFPRVGWPRAGEIDIFEMVNGHDNGTIDDSSILHGTLHMNQYGENGTQINHIGDGGTINAKKGTYWGDDWHEYGILWNSTTFSFQVDSMSYYTIDLTSATQYNSFADPTNPFFFVINLAVGGQFPNHKVDDSAFPAHLMVDWVRVYQTQMDMERQREVEAKNPILKNKKRRSAHQ